MPQLLDFIITGFTVYNRYLEFISNPNVSITEIGNLEYKVQSFTDSKLFYYVDMLTCKCTCPLE